MKWVKQKPTLRSNFWFDLIRGGIGEVLENYGLLETGSVGYITAADELRS